MKGDGMKKYLLLVLALATSTLIVSCGPSYKAQADKAFKQAEKASGYQKRILEKKAYIFYLKAINAREDAGKPVSTELIDKFIKTTIIRSNMILTEASANVEAIDLFINDVDSVMSDKASPEIRNQYAQLLSRLADSAMTNGQVTRYVSLMDKAIDIADNTTKFKEKKEEQVGSYVDKSLKIAKKVATAAESTEVSSGTLVRGEFYAKKALLFDSSSDTAKQLLHLFRKKNQGSYSAYERVIDSYSDTALFDAINEYDIFLAVPTIHRKGGLLKMNVSVFNYSYNPIRLWAKNFYIVDTEGNKYTALESSKFDQEILDQDHETKEVVLVFKNPSNKAKKLCYKHKDHYTEKYLR